MTRMSEAVTLFFARHTCAFLGLGTDVSRFWE